MSDRKMTGLHEAVLVDAVTRFEKSPAFQSHPRWQENAKALREILDLIESLASGELRCADTKTEVVRRRDDLRVLAERIRRGDILDYEIPPIIDRWLSTPDLPAKMSEQGEEMVHATNASDYSRGGIIGWRDARSPTGWLSGVVVESDSRALCVRVKDIRPGIMRATPDLPASPPTEEL